jgi:glycerophosphoryl diester phosphodiesterase
VKVFGHRGSPGFPRHGENTIANFRRALDEGADGVEFDIRRCGDGQLVVIHDETLDRTTNGTGPVTAFAYSDIAKLDAGHGERVPLLSEVLDTFGSRCLLHIELKEIRLAEEVASMVTGRNLQNHVTVSGFRPFWEELARIRSRVPIALLASADDIQQIVLDRFTRLANELGAEAIHIAKEAANEDVVRLARAAHLAVRVFTVNSPDDVRRLASLGVDGIFSDYPGRSLQVLRDARL